MNKIISSSVTGDIPQLSQLEQGDIAVNNADAVLWIVQIVGGVKQVVQLSGIPSFNGRAGAITLTYNDVVTALNFTPANQTNATLTGIPTAPTADPGTDSTQIATTAFVQTAVQDIVLPSATQRLDKLLDVDITEGAGIDQMFLQYSQQAGLWQAAQLAPVALTNEYTSLTGIPDLATVALTASYDDLVNIPDPYDLPIASTEALGGIIVGDTLSISENGTLNALYSTTLAGLSDVNIQEIPSQNNTVLQYVSSNSKWTNKALADVAFSGSYTDLINAPQSTVISFNARTGAVGLESSDITGAGGALLASPAFSGTPTAPTPTAGDNSQNIATTAFVHNAVTTVASAGVSSFNTRTGAVQFEASDITSVGGALLASPAFSGVPTAPTASAGTNSFQLATTQFVTTAIANADSLLAPINSPELTGTPTAPTAASGTNTTQVATTSFVAAAKYYDVDGGAIGAITASQLLKQFVSGRTITFPSGLVDSQGYAATAPTDSVTFTITANETNVGTMVFAAGSNTATFTASSAFTLTPGQILTIVGPASADATLATVSFTLLGLAE